MAASTERRRIRGYQQGYEATFAPPLERKYVCPICLAALREAVQTTCGHRFCRACLSELIDGNVYLRCPVDNKWLSSDVEIFPDVAMRREVLSLFVCCDYHIQGCQWTGELRELETHVSGCAFILSPCTNECGEMLNTDQLTQHMLVCNKRLIACQHCESQVVYSEMTKHQVLICTKFPVKCTLCGKMGINREDIPKHVNSLTGDCPQALVLCKYSVIGCTAQETRQRLPDHYKEECDQHLELAMVKVKTQLDFLFQSVESISFNEHSRTANNLGLLMERVDEQPQLLGALQSIQPKGTLYWRLDLHEGSDGRIRSPAFFTGFPGYKVCVSLDLEGYTESGEGVTYTFLCVELQPGDFDQSLTFPVSGLCRVTLFNHSEGAVSQNNYSTAFNCTDLRRCYEGESSVYSSRFLPKDDVFKYCRQRVLYLDVSFTPICSNSQSSTIQHDSRWGTVLQ